MSRFVELTAPDFFRFKIPSLNSGGKLCEAGAQPPTKGAGLEKVQIFGYVVIETLPKEIPLSSPQSHKDRIRKDMKTRLREFIPDARATASRQISRYLRDLPNETLSREILAFWPLKDEPEIQAVYREWIQAGKSVYLPRTAGSCLVFHLWDGHRDSLETSTLGFSQPHFETPRLLPGTEPSLVLVPGLAFDTQGNRLGRGGGYYDRFLPSLKSQGKAMLILGCSFTCQLLESLPRDSWDQTMDAHISEVGLLKF